MNTIYAVQFNNEIPRVFCTTREIAIHALRVKRAALLSRLVHVTEDKDMSFTFHFGWAEQGGTWHVVEIPLVDNAKLAVNLLGE